MACIGTGFLSGVLTSCKPTHYLTGTLEGNGLSIPASEFTYLQNDKPMTRSFVIVHNDKLEFPICIFRLSDTEYKSLWMKCTHQGSELLASGDQLYCTSHGSEFDKNGNVTQGPAETSLRSFPTSLRDNKIFIQLT